jgi:hypothetical protein
MAANINAFFEEIKRTNWRDPGTWHFAPKTLVLLAVLVGIPVAGFFLDTRSQIGELEKGQADEPPAASAGFPAVESRLEKSSIEAVAEELRPSYEKLEAMASTGTPKTKAAAKKAMGAYERTADLFEYLFATKSAIQ